MIQCDKTPNGGTIRVRGNSSEAHITFVLSDHTGTPLSLQITEEYGSDPRLTVAVVDSLVERYNSPVVWFRTGNAELRYLPYISNSVYRHSTVHEESLFTRPFNDGKAFTRIYSLAEAMSNYALVRSVNEELQIFDTRYCQSLGKR